MRTLTPQENNILSTLIAFDTPEDEAMRIVQSEDYILFRDDSEIEEFIGKTFVELYDDEDNPKTLSQMKVDTDDILQTIFNRHDCHGDWDHGPAIIAL